MLFKVKSNNAVIVIKWKKLKLDKNIEILMMSFYEFLLSLYLPQMISQHKNFCQERYKMILPVHSKNQKILRLAKDEKR